MNLADQGTAAVRRRLVVGADPAPTVTAEDTKRFLLVVAGATAIGMSLGVVGHYAIGAFEKKR